MKKAYIPAPIDTEDVKLPDELLSLVEEIARNVHEVWAKGRIDQGWKYGRKRDEELKLHPCLIPYEDLTEEEKDYDRKTALGTLKMIQKLGFQISINIKK